MIDRQAMRHDEEIRAPGTDQLAGRSINDAYGGFGDGLLGKGIRPLPAAAMKHKDTVLGIHADASTQAEDVAFGQLRSVRIGRAVRIRPRDLEEYIAGAVREG